MIGIADILNHSDDSNGGENSDGGFPKRGGNPSAKSTPCHLNSRPPGLANGPTSDSKFPCSYYSKDLGLDSMQEQGMHLNTSGSTTSKHRNHEPGTTIPRPATKPTNSSSSTSSYETSGSSASSTVSRLSLMSSNTSTAASTPHDSADKNSGVSESPEESFFDAIPKTKIHKYLLADKNFVKLAIRRKSTSKRNNSLNHLNNKHNPICANSKLHVKSLEAGLRVKLTMANSLINLYHSLIPFTSKKDILPIFENPDFSVIEGKPDKTKNEHKMSKKSLISKSVKLIDNNLVDLSGFSNKILQSFNLVEDEKLPKGLTTFNSLDTAVHTLFGIKDYSLIRVTRSTSDDYDGSVVLKLETAHRGDFKLIDEVDFMDEMIYSLGNKGDPPSNLFIKKVVARPRYKSDMKIYFVEQKINCSLYTDERMFERDLFNGVIDLTFERVPENNSENSELKEVIVKGDRDVFVTFPYQEIVDEYKRLLKLSQASESVDTESQSPQSSDSMSGSNSKCFFELEKRQPQKVPSLDKMIGYVLDRESNGVSNTQIANNSLPPASSPIMRESTSGESGSYDQHDLKKRKIRQDEV